MAETKLAILVAFAVVTAGMPKARARDCDKLLAQGVFNEERALQRPDVRAAAEALMCTQASSRAGQTSGGGIRIGLPIDGIPLELGGGYQNGSFNEWGKKHCAASASSSSYSDVIERTKKTASEALLNAYNLCLKGDPVGLTCEARKQGADHVTFDVSWRPPRTTDAAPKVRSFYVWNANCPVIPQAESVINTSYESYVCDINPAKDAGFQLRTDAGPCTVMVDAVPPVPKDDRLQCLSDADADACRRLVGSLRAMANCEQRPLPVSCCEASVVEQLSALAGDIKRACSTTTDPNCQTAKSMFEEAKQRLSEASKSGCGGHAF